MSTAEAEAFFAKSQARMPAAHKSGVYILAEPTTAYIWAAVE